MAVRSPTEGLGPNAVAAYHRWFEAVLAQADHQIDCTVGCSIFGDVCDVGITAAEVERSTWLAWHQARNADGAP